MTEDVLTFEELRQVQSRERDSDTLQELDDDFFDRARAYLDMKRDGEDVLQNQEYRNARNLLQDIVDRRQKKIVKLAFLSVKSGVSVDNLMAHEEELFDDLTDAIEDHRYDIEDALLDGDGAARAPALDGEDGAAESDEVDGTGGEEPGAAADESSADDIEDDAAEDEDDTEEDVDSAKDGDDDEDDAGGEKLLFGGDDGDEDDTEPGESGDADDDMKDAGDTADGDEDDTGEAGDGMARVRATTDVQEFMGTDLEAYGPFEEGEEAVVPEKNADVLQEQGKAERL